MQSGIVGKLWSVTDQSHGRSGKEQISDSIRYIENEYKCSSEVSLESFFQVGRELHYVTNKLKTLDGLLIGGRKITDVGNAAKEMIDVKEYFHKTDGRVALHGVISLPEEESDEKNAARLMMLVDEVLKDLFPRNQIVYAVHTNTQNLHCHFIVNTVGLDGKKIHMDKQFLRDVFQPTINLYAKKYGFTPNEKWGEKPRKDMLSFAEKKMMLRDYIDEAIEKAESFSDVVAYLRKQGVVVNTGKHMSLKVFGMSKAIRSSSLGKNYTIERINERIRSKYDDFIVIGAKEPVADISHLKGRYHMQSIKRYKDMTEDEKKEAVRLLRMGNNPWTIQRENNWHMQRISDELSRTLSVNELIEFYGNGSIGKSKDEIIKLQKESSQRIKEIRKNLKEYKPQISLYQRMIDLSKAAFLYEQTKEEIYQEAFDEYKLLEKRLYEGYHKSIYDVDAFYNSQLEELDIQRGQLAELKKQYKLIYKYEHDSRTERKDEAVSIFDAIGFNEALKNVKNNIFATEERFVVTDDNDYFIHVITTPAIIEGKKSIKTSVMVLNLEGKVFEEISTDQMDIKEFNKTLFEIENKYGFYSCKSLINEKELKEHIQKTRRQK